MDSSNLNDFALNETVDMEEAEQEGKAETEKAAETKEEESEQATAMDDTQTSDACDGDQQPETDVAEAASSCKPKKTVTIDVQKMEELLESIVFVTKGWSVEKLLRLYTKLAKLADRYSKLWNRTELVQVYERSSICIIPYQNN